MDKILSKIDRLLAREDVDWDKLESLLDVMKDSINDKINDETMLSDGMHAVRYHDGETLLKLVEKCLEHGYDVSANGGFNGGHCLSELCWTTYDRYIIDAAKCLLEAGADPLFDEDPDDHLENDLKGVLGSISFKLSGLWNSDCDYEMANVYEAYYQLIEAAQNSKNYRKINTYHHCIGDKLISIKRIANSDSSADEFTDGLVITFRNSVLVFDAYMSCVSNPLFAAEHADKLEIVTSDVRMIEGQTLMSVEYLDANTAKLHFENGYNLYVLSTYLMGTSRQSTNKFGIIPDVNGFQLNPNEQFEWIRYKSGTGYSATTRDYSEQSLFLKCAEGTYIVGVHEENDKCSLTVNLLNHAWTQSLSRSFTKLPVTFIADYRKNGLLKAIQLKVEEKNIYLVPSTKWAPKVQTILCTNEFPFSQLVSGRVESEKLKFHDDPWEFIRR